MNMVEIPDKEIEVTNCPWCFSAKSKNYKRFGNIGMQRCKSCNLIFTSPRVMEEHIGKYYGIDYLSYVGSASATENHTRFYIKHLNKIKRYANGEDLLEIGSGGGGFANTAKKLGFNVKIQDISEENVREIFNKYKIEGFCGKLEDLEFKTKTYNVLVMHHVLEHVYDIHAFMQNAYRILKDDGLLVVLLPYPFTVDRFFNYQLKCNLLSLPYHTIHLNKKHAERIFSHYNFSVIQEEHSVPAVFSSASSLLRRLCLRRLKLEYVDRGNSANGSSLLTEQGIAPQNRYCESPARWTSRFIAQCKGLLSNTITGEQLCYYLRKD